MFNKHKPEKKVKREREKEREKSGNFFKICYPQM
jgi:hypothetical protein